MATTHIQNYEALLRDASTTALSATASSTIDFNLLDVERLFFIYDGTATVTGTSPTLDISVQISPDKGTTWYPIARYAQITTNTDRQLLLNRNYREATLKDPTGAEGALAAATGGTLVQNVPWTNTMRVTFTVGGTSPAFKFKFWLIAQRYPSNS